MKNNKFTNYDKCLEFLFGLERVGIKYDLKNIKALLKFLDNPQKKFKSIHIAGTNGKGSVASALNSVLIENGFVTGLYTSPHIIDFRERILINGEKISKQFVIDFTNRVYKLITKIIPSFFEVTTAMAFEYFAQKKVDYAVIETGLGGRLDSTNVLKPILSIITGISIDHTEYLGNTIKGIAKEKAGIIKHGIPVVIGNIKGIAKEVIKKKSFEKSSEFIESKKVSGIKILSKNEIGIQIDYKGSKIKYPVIGDYQISNIKTSLSAINKFCVIENTEIKNGVIKKGFENLVKNSNFYGRFQLVKRNPSVVIDVSHNIEGIANIKSSLKYFRYKNLFIIFGMMKDKNFKACVNEIEKLDAKIILTKPDYKRAAEPEILYKSAINKKKFFISENIKSAYKNAMKFAGKNDLILVTGSFFLLSDFLKNFEFDIS